jgi:hypothetical protein
VEQSWSVVSTIVALVAVRVVMEQPNPLFLWPTNAAGHAGGETFHAALRSDSER